MNRRQLLSAAFAATASGLLVPEPRRTYSFLWNRKTEYERIVRLTREAIERALLGQALVMPPGVNVEIVSSSQELLREKRLTARVTVQPLSWGHAARLLSQGFELA